MFKRLSYSWGFWLKKYDIWLVFLFCLTVFVFLQNTHTLGDPDSFYHARLTTFLRDFGLLHDFPWTQASLYKEYFIDHHLGYHLLILPFISIFSELIGLKIATALLASFTVTVVVWLLKKWQVKYYWLSLLLLLSAPAFLFRLSLGKAPSVGIGVALIGYYFINQRQYVWLFLWSWFFTWLYSAWPLLLVMAVIFLVAEGFYKYGFNLKIVISSWFKKDNYILVSCILLGYILGLILNPYFPTNIIYLKQLFTMSLVSYNSFLGIGAEWYPYSLPELLPNISLVLLVWLLGLIVALFNLKKVSHLSWSTFLLTIVLFVYTLKARRQVEYLTPVMVLSAGLFLRDTWGWWNQYNIKKEVKDWMPRILKNKFIQLSLVIYLITAIGFSLGFGLYKARNSLKNSINLKEMQDASAWLKQNTSKGDLIWQTDWGSFPLLWFYNQKNYYLTGLDQTFMYEYNPDLYWQWVGVNKGLRKDIYQVVKNNFKADYVLLQKKYAAMLPWLNRDQRFEKKYEDMDNIIYKVN